MPDRFDRDGAFSIELGADRDDAVQQMIALNETLYVFSTKKIFESTPLTTSTLTAQHVIHATPTKRSIRLAAATPLLHGRSFRQSRSLME